jgi:hypothetical protein
LLGACWRSWCFLAVRCLHALLKQSDLPFALGSRYFILLALGVHSDGCGLPGLLHFHHAAAGNKLVKRAASTVGLISGDLGVSQ